MPPKRRLSVRRSHPLSRRGSVPAPRGCRRRSRGVVSAAFRTGAGHCAPREAGLCDDVQACGPRQGQLPIPSSGLLGRVSYGQAPAADYLKRRVAVPLVLGRLGLRAEARGPQRAQRLAVRAGAPVRAPARHRPSRGTGHPDAAGTCYRRRGRALGRAARHCQRRPPNPRVRPSSLLLRDLAASAAGVARAASLTRIRPGPAAAPPEYPAPATDQIPAPTPAPTHRRNAGSDSASPAH